MHQSADELRAAKARHEREWLALEGVVAVGIGTTSARGDGLIVSVRRQTGELLDRIPRDVEGVPVEVRETGDIQAL